MTTRRDPCAALCLVTALLILVGCSGPAAPAATPPSLIVISIDTLRRDRVSAYGEPGSRTPSLDRLAAEGARFTAARTPTTWTLPSHTSLFTGLAPSAHRVEDIPDTIPRELTTLTEVLADAGFATGAFASHVYFERRYGFDQGFQTYDVVVDRQAAQVVDRALAWLGMLGDRRAFLFMHLFDPHWNYAPPPRYAPGVDRRLGTFRFLAGHHDPEQPFAPAAADAVTRLYDGETRYVDDQLGRLFDALRASGRLDRSVVVVLADHGEELRDHDSLGHGYTLLPELARVPLLIRHPPTIAAGTRVDTPVLLTDLPATLLAMLGVPVPDSFLIDGAVLPIGAAAAHATLDPGRALVLETSCCFTGKRFAVHRGGLAYHTPFTYPVPSRLSDRPDYYAAGKLSGMRPRTRPEALYCTGNDPAAHDNLLERDDASASAPRCGGQPVDVAATVAAMRRELWSFVRARARGVRIACHATDPGHAGAALEGRALVEQTLADEPYGVGFDDGDTLLPVAADGGGFAWMLERHSDYRFRFELPAAGEKGLVLPVAPGTHELRLHLALGGEPFYLGQLPLPPPGTQGELVADGAACTLEGENPPLAETAAGAISAEQREQLEALGYLQ